MNDSNLLICYGTWLLIMVIIIINVGNIFFFFVETMIYFQDFHET